MAGHKRQFVFHEQRGAEKILKVGFKDGVVNGREALMVTKLYRKLYGYGATRLEKAIISFCKEHDPNFNPVVEQDSIAVWIKGAMKFELHDSKNIKVYHHEMIEIMKIKDLRQRKLLFVILVLSKSMKSSSNTSEKYYLHFSNIAQVITMSGFKIKEGECLAMMRPLVQAGLLHVYAPERESIGVKFAVTSGSVALTVPDPSQVLESYRAFFGGDVSLCATCGEEIIKTGNKTKYCEVCAKKSKKEKDIARITKNRKSVRK
jgi:hypothetical protein